MKISDTRATLGAMSGERASYRELPPSADLAEHVACFWTIAAAAPKTTWAPTPVFPDGCIDLLFDFTCAHAPGTRFVGAMTRPIFVANKGAIDLLGVRFTPGGARPFFSVSAVELTDRNVPIEELWREDPTDALRGLSTRQRIEHLEQTLRKKLEPKDPSIAAAVTLIAARRGDLKIRELERALGWSSRQLERKFRDHVGLGPKRLARVLRFQRVLREAEAARGAWLDAALALGFSDQAHLAREVREMSGSSLTELFSARP